MRLIQHTYYYSLYLFKELLAQNQKTMMTRIILF